MTSLPKKVLNFTKAMTKFALGGFQTVSEKIYEQRIGICDACPLLKEGECGLCGCPVTKKALLSTESCPDKKWGAEIKKPASGFSANDGGSAKPKKCSSCKNRH